jgi:FkbM family methyltransferase
MTATDPGNYSTADWPILKRLCIPFVSRLRRAHRLFRLFPPMTCRTILDIGAFEGEFTEGALAYFRPARVWLVEADPELAAALRAKFQMEPACRVVHAAICDRPGEIEFRVNAHRPSSSLLPISSGTSGIFGLAMDEVRSVRVPALSLDDLFVRESLPEVDLMKVDIQGAERLLIQGGRAALRRVQCLYIEVLFEECYTGCALFPEIHALLVESGFKLRLFYDCRRGTDGSMAYANALYFRPSAR